MQPSSPVRRLDECPRHTHWQIVDLQENPVFGDGDSRVTLRLKELGFLPGVRLGVIGFGLMGSDPLAVKINGTRFALRRAEASKVLVQALDDTP